MNPTIKKNAETLLKNNIDEMLVARIVKGAHKFEGIANLLQFYVEENDAKIPDEEEKHLIIEDIADLLRDCGI
jgi:hypothetical protein